MKKDCAQTGMPHGDKTQVQSPETGRTVSPSQMDLGFGFLFTTFHSSSQDKPRYFSCDTIYSNKNKQKVRSPLISGYFLYVTWSHGAINKDMYMLPTHYVTLGKQFPFPWTCLPSCKIGNLGVDYLPRSLQPYGSVIILLKRI